MILFRDRVPVIKRKFVSESPKKKLIKRGRVTNLLTVINIFEKNNYTEKKNGLVSLDIYERHFSTTSFNYDK